MSLENNAFYLLKVSCSANRKEIVAAAEEMSFLLDADVCSNAQNELINLNKRLDAEFDWFLGADPKKIDEIRQNIEEGTCISTEGLDSLSRLNATVYNFTISEEDDILDTGYAILDIDEQFSNLDESEIAEEINTCRSTAKMALVSEQDILKELNRKRESIRQIITDKLGRLDQDSYVELVTLIAEKCIADEDYDDGVILADAIDQYEVRMQSTLEQSTSSIKAYIAMIKTRNDNDDFMSYVKALIARVKAWDKLAQPLQLKSQASGMPHEISENLGYELRNLALFLHNEKGKSEEALTLVNAMKDVFAELGVLVDTFEEDSDALEELVQGEREANEIMDEMNSLLDLSKSIQVSPSRYGPDGITKFNNRVIALDKNMKTIGLDAETLNKIRESLCYMARSLAIELHNKWHETSLALSITSALRNEFSDLPSVKSQLDEDYRVLSQQAVFSRSNYSSTRTTSTSTSSSTSTSRSNSNSGGLGCGGRLVVGLILLIIFGFVIYSASNGNSSNSSTKTSSTYSSTTSTPKPTTDTEVEFSNSTTTVGQKVYADIVSIFPDYGIYTEGSIDYSHFVCSCKTSSGSTVWVYMTVSEYRVNFDSSASSSVYTHSAEEVTFSYSKRIHGTVKRAESILTGLSKDTGTVVIDFSSKS